MRSTVAAAYEVQGHDAVRARFEVPWFGRLVRGLLREAGGAELLELGCGDGGLAGLAPARYLGVDLAPPLRGGGALSFLRHDLRDGLGPVGARPFDLYLGAFGLASHLAPGELRRLLREIAAHARPGAIVAIEALGLFSLEWPRLWDRAPGSARTIPYRLAAEVDVHPWAPAELCALFEGAGIEPLRALDRTLQAGPKAGEYWPGLPAVREALGALCAARATYALLSVLAAPLPPLPACGAALMHHTLAAWRGALVRRRRHALAASEVWRLEPCTGGGFGHGLLVVGRVR